MSMMICEKCDKLVDTDFDLEGIWSDTGYTCECCTEEIEAQTENENE
jgi:hypothetical protein